MTQLSLYFFVVAKYEPLFFDDSILSLPIATIMQEYKNLNSEPYSLAQIFNNFNLKND